MVTLKVSSSVVQYPSGDQSGVAFPRVGTGTSAAVADMDNGIKDTLSKGANTKLCSDTGEKGCHPEDPDRPERWGCVNLMNLNKGKCKVLQLGQGTSTGWEEKGLGSPEEKDSGVMVDGKLNRTQPCKLSSHEVKCVLGCI